MTTWLVLGIVALLSFMGLVLAILIGGYLILKVFGLDRDSLMHIHRRD